MQVDNYPQSFEHLSNIELPNILAQLKELAQSPIPMSKFALPGSGPKKIASQLGLVGDFSGCYVLIENCTPVYVGISKQVLKRLSQHVKGKTHFDASLAYRMASTRKPHHKTRTEAMNNPTFKLEFETARAKIQQLHVAFVEITNPLVLYFFEPYCAMHFDTGEWNTFETH